VTTVPASRISSASRVELLRASSTGAPFSVADRFAGLEADGADLDRVSPFRRARWCAADRPDPRDHLAALNGLTT
jgi:hypothetical protein